MQPFKYVPRRVCLPVGMACNVECRYCMRMNGKTREPKLTPLIREYLQWLDPKTTEAVVINGGEPLLYIDRIKEIRSLVHPNIHFTVMTNGILLTEEFAEWLNENNGELHFSHEGLGAKELKGVDVLEDPKVVKALNIVKRMRIYNLLTSCNPDIMANYEYIMGHLPHVKNIYFTSFPMFAFAGNEHLVKDFDFDLFQKSFMEFVETVPNEYRSNPHLILHDKRKMLGLNVLLDGSIASISTLKVYGTVFNTREEIYEKVLASEDNAYCLNRKCDVRGTCTMAPQCANDFSCKCMAIITKVNNAYRNLRQYNSHD